MAGEESTDDSRHRGRGGDGSPGQARAGDPYGQEQARRCGSRRTPLKVATSIARAATRTAASRSSPTNPTRPLESAATFLQRHIVPVIALGAVLCRLPFLTSDPSRDEAGFLLVGQQWRSGGSSLYGDYWVDRPPLLISIFEAAARLGGLVPLRLIGSVATVLVVLGAAHVARRLGGSRAATWAALTAAALCVNPLLGGQSVNGELLSAPFVVGGLAAVLAAIDEPNDRRAALFAALAGAAAMASLLVKQNMADVGVFAGVTLVVAWRRGEVSTPRLVRSVLAGAVGALVCLGVLALWTTAHGTSVAGVYDAMYPFRLEAARVMAASDRSAADARLWLLLGYWLLSGGALVSALALQALASRQLRSAAVWGLIATVLFDAVSIALGGSYWNHYLIQLVAPVAIFSGLLVSSRHVAARTVLTATAVAAVVALGAKLTGSHPTTATSIGQAIRDVSRPQDTIVTIWGHADLTYASGLDSPYPFLWSLPARTRDPDLTDLSTLLAGPRAPTWFVTWTGVSTGGSSGGGAVAARLLAERYEPVAQVDGRTIYRHRGVQRAAPALPDTT